MIKIYYVHGWASNSIGPTWISWLKEECEKNGIEFIAFKMPNPGNPKISEWVEFLRDNIGELDEDTFLLGHSIGCQTILRYLESLPKDEKIGGCIFVAGWFNLLENAYEDENDKKIAVPWIETDIDFNKVKKHTNNFVAIFSEDDPCVPVSDAELFKERLGARVIIKQHNGHFDDSKKIDEILEEGLMNDKINMKVWRK